MRRNYPETEAVAARSGRLAARFRGVRLATTPATLNADRAAGGGPAALHSFAAPGLALSAVE